MKKIILLFFFIAAQLSDSIAKETASDSLFPFTRFRYSSSLIQPDSNGVKGKLKIPFKSVVVPVEKIMGMTLINPMTALIRNTYFCFLPSWIHHLPASKSDSITSRARIYLQSVEGLNTDMLFKPFYFKSNEVTNAEYRVFVFWVRDSIARTLLAQNLDPEKFLIYNDTLDNSQRLLNWDAELDYYDEKNKEVLQEMYYPTNERYYRRREFDVRKYNYIYYHPDTSIKKQGSERILKEKLNIYPDTSKWLNNLNLFSVLGYDLKPAEMYSNMYFWHPAFDNYPVVGVSWKQAKAFCHWKTQMLNKERRKKKLKGEIEVDLPYDFEWETVEMHIGKIEQSPAEPQLLNELSYNVILSQIDVLFPANVKAFIEDVEYKSQNHYRSYWIENTGLMEVTRKQIVEKSLARVPYHPDFNADFLILDNDGKPAFSIPMYSVAMIPSKWNLPKNGIPSPAMKQFERSQSNAAKIFGMNGHVSEWLSSGYTALREELLIIRQMALFNMNGGESNRGSFLLRPETFTSPYKMLKGATMLDLRNAINSGSAVTTFAHPDSSYCTVGFRYVIRMK